MALTIAILQRASIWWTIMMMMMIIQIIQQNNMIHSFTIPSCTSTSTYQNRNALITILPTVKCYYDILKRRGKQQQQQLFSSFTADGSEYAAGDSDFDNEDDYDDTTAAALLRKNNNDDEQQQQLEEDEDDENRFVPTIELQPVPISKNAGNRFVAVIWDRIIKNREQFVHSYNTNENDDNNVDEEWKQWNDHYDRIRYTEDHVMFCRKQNLYNTTFNQHSMVDILWSLPMYVPVLIFLYQRSFFFDGCVFRRHITVKYLLTFSSFFLYKSVE
jgi:hypothetical protein